MMTWFRQEVTGFQWGKVIRNGISFCNHFRKETSVVIIVEYWRKYVSCMQKRTVKLKS